MSRSMTETLVRMDIGEVLAILVSLEEAGCSVWVAGGWGVDALVGQQTRPHRDLDLAVDANDESSAVGVLRRAGYQIETDWRAQYGSSWLLPAADGWTFTRSCSGLMDTDDRPTSGVVILTTRPMGSPRA